MNLMPIYSVPLWQSEFPDFEKNKEVFLTTIQEFRKNNSSKETPRSNISGYQSPDVIQKLPEFASLFEYICQMAYQASADLNFIDCDVAVTSAWVNINDSRQCMNSEHIHGDVFSGVFYLKAPEGSGRLSVSNLAINKMWMGCSLAHQKNQFTAESIKIEPVEGDIILFPSYLPHSVETNNHDDERISISFNIIALPKGSIPRM